MIKHVVLSNLLRQESKRSDRTALWSGFCLVFKTRSLHARTRVTEARVSTYVAQVFTPGAHKKQRNEVMLQRRNQRTETEGFREAFDHFFTPDKRH